MKKKIKKMGGCTGISFTKEEREIIGLTVGDIITIHIKDIETKEAEA